MSSTTPKGCGDHFGLAKGSTCAHLQADYEDPPFGDWEEPWGMEEPWERHGWEAYAREEPWERQRMEWAWRLGRVLGNRPLLPKGLGKDPRPQH